MEVSPIGFALFTINPCIQFWQKKKLATCKLCFSSSNLNFFTFFCFFVNVPWFYTHFNLPNCLRVVSRELTLDITKRIKPEILGRSKLLNTKPRSSGQPVGVSLAYYSLSVLASSIYIFVKTRK